MQKILVRILFVLALVWAWGARAERVVDLLPKTKGPEKPIWAIPEDADLSAIKKRCLKKIEERKRKPCFSCMGDSTVAKEFWSTRDSECYAALADGKTGFAKSLRKQGYEVEFGDYEQLCTEFCHVASVGWAKVKNLGLSKKEREAVALAYSTYEHENSGACHRAAPPGTVCDHEERWAFFDKCLKRTGNVGRCHKEFYAKEKK